MRVPLSVLAVLAAAAIAAHAATAAQIKPASPYVHPSGMQFPGTVGDFRRTSVDQFDPQGLDVGVGYRLSATDSPIVATVYIYPAPPAPANASTAQKDALCGRDLQRWKQEVVTLHPAARVVEERRPASPHGDTSHFGRMTVFEFRDKFFGTAEDLRSLLYVYCFVGGKWDFEYRVTYPKRFDAKARPRVDAFMKALPWTIPQ